MSCRLQNSPKLLKVKTPNINRVERWENSARKALQPAGRDLSLNVCRNAKQQQSRFCGPACFVEKMTQSFDILVETLGVRKMDGILIEYDYAGDENVWRNAVDAFVSNIDADERLRGRFSYRVNTRGDAGSRVHIGTWDSEETLAHLQAQEFFKTFAGQVQSFAGDSLKTSRFHHVAGTVQGE